MQKRRNTLAVALPAAIIFFLLLPAIAFAGAAQANPANGVNEDAFEVRVIIDGSTVAFHPQPRIINGSIMVPMRPFFQELGARVEWLEEEQAITSQLGERKAKIYIGVGKALVNDKTLVNLEIPPVLIDGRAFVPLRFTSKALGCEVEWDDESRTAFIFSTPPPEFPLVREELSKEEVAELGSKATVTIKGEEMMGSGFYLGDGLVATSFHVLEGQFRLSLLTHDDVSHDQVEIAVFDRERDLAILHAPEVELPALPLGDSDHLKVGQSVIAVGSPLEFTGTVSAGVISKVERQVDKRKYIQFSAPISPGSSGGPLLDLFGEVIGIPSAYAPMGESIGFAVPINKLEPLMEKAVERKNGVPEEKDMDNES